MRNSFLFFPKLNATIKRNENDIYLLLNNKKCDKIMLSLNK